MDFSKELYLDLYGRDNKSFPSTILSYGIARNLTGPVLTVVFFIFNHSYITEPKEKVG